jgi:ACS family hexuronate transporter-like MFS transporter
MTAAEQQKPLRRRWWVLLLLFAAITINILDRQVLSLVAPVLRDELGLSNTEYGAIVFCFLLGMTIGQIPVGMMIDRIGARLGFSLIIVWWSIANMLHAAARSMMQFSVLRFLMGLGECGSYSGGVKAISQWFPTRERALAGGIFNSGTLIGAIIAPPLVVFLTLKFGWHSAFLLPSGLGLLWILPWLRTYWEPWRHPRLTEEERRTAEAARPAKNLGQTEVRILPLLGVSAVWGVILMRTLGGPVTHFYWYWLPEYLKRERVMSLEMIGMFAWLPFFSGGLGNVGGGWFSSWLIRRGWTLDRARKAAFLLAVALCLVAVFVPAAPNAAWALLLICLASLGINAFAANLIGLLTDLFPEQLLARISGLTGVGDGTMGMITMLATGIVVDHFSYLPVFIAAGVLPLLALAALFILVGKVEPVAMP